MKYLVVEIPDNFTKDLENSEILGKSQFEDSLDRISYDAKNSPGTKLAGRYDFEILDMVKDAIKNARPLMTEN